MSAVIKKKEYIDGLICSSSANTLKDTVPGNEISINYFDVCQICDSLLDNMQLTNLVPNPGFEKYRVCPENYTVQPKSYFVDDWNMPTLGTPDYFNICSRNAGVPYNWAGKMQAHGGYGYVGLITGKYYNNHESREYIQTRLIQPLEQGKAYCVSFHTALAQNSQFASDGIGVYFSKKGTDYTDYVKALPLEPQVKGCKGCTYSDYDHWHKVCGIFWPEGGEEYLITGNFNNEKQTFYEEMNEYGRLRYAYYYLDDISVIEIPVNIQNDLDEIFRQDPVILNNVYFDFNESVLLSSSYYELNRLVSFLRLLPGMKVMISGHTDDIGSTTINMNLSLERAKRVVDYLVNQGIDPVRLSYEGCGNTRPLSTSKTPEGRRLNRRVEFKVMDQ